MVWASWLCRATVGSCNIRVECGSRPHPLKVFWQGDVVVRLWLFMPSSQGFPPPLFHAMVLTASEKSVWKLRKTLFPRHDQGRAGQRAHHRRPLAHPFVAWKGRSAERAFKVIALDKKGICSGSRAADTSTFSFFGSPGHSSAMKVLSRSLCVCIKALTTKQWGENSIVQCSLSQ